MDEKTLKRKLGYKIDDDDSSNELDEIVGKWWYLAGDKLANSITAIVNKIYNQQTNRRLDNLRNARLYSNRNFVGFAPDEWNKVGSNKKKLTLNVVKSCADTATAKISKNRPRALFLTSGGDYEAQERAKLATKYIDGLFESTNIYQIAQQIFLDSTVQDIGALKVFIEEGEIKVERVFPNEILVDEEDGQYGSPSQIFQVKNAKVSSLLYMYPNSKQVIKAAAKNDRVRIVEAWHLKSGNNADDGKHAICIDGATLFEESWDKNYFPILSFRWQNSLVGYYGTSLAEEISTLQLEINKVLNQISKAIEGAVPRVFLDSASSINKAQITDELWSIITYTGRQPTFSPTSANPGEIYNYLWQLVGKAYEISGISQLSATGSRPSGIDSGVALRTLQDVESQRFVLQGQRWEKWFVDMAHIMIDLTRDITKTNKNFSVKVKDGNTLQEIKWLKDIDLKEDQYIMQAWPVSALPETPAGKLQFVSELMQQKFITNKETALSLLNYPDLQQYMSLETASIDNINRSISIMLKKGIYVPPTRYLPLEVGLQLVQGALLRGMNEDREDDKLDLLRMWIDEAEQMLKPPAPPAPPAPSAPPAPPNPNEQLPPN